MTKRFLLVPLCAVVLVALVITVIPAAAQDGYNPLTAEVAVLVPEVIAEYEHDSAAFTQGLILYNGSFFESAGQWGESNLREVDPETGEVLRSVDVADDIFAEGLERVGDRLIQLTWKSEKAFVYDLETFEQVASFDYTGEGWGLCSDGRYLYMSDGSPFLTLRDIDTFEVVFKGMVTLQGTPVYQINELECVGDYVYANVWQTDYIIQIDKTNGVVVAVVDATGLLSEEERAELEDGSVLNGIAYNPDSDTFMLTGKRWPKMFEVTFVEKPADTTG
ncbi:MAG: glutaminyl-peptide cyclotransferase [Anaerolineae bacterium]|nr:glutaminyl-peptide cyclotransferase [Anaerolineae bacterium]